MQELPLISRARAHADRCVFRNVTEEHTYRQLLERSESIAGGLLGDNDDLQEARIAYLIPAGFQYTSTQWGIWRAGGIAVPLSLSATEPELEYTLTDSQVSQVVVPREHSTWIDGLCEKLGLRVVVEEDVPNSQSSLPNLQADRRAMILYTSGTTSKPKGVVSTARQHSGTNRSSGEGVGVAGGRPHSAIPAAASHPRHHQRHVVCDLGGSRDRAFSQV